MKRCWLLLICLMRATFPTCADRFKISLCRLPNKDDFHFFAKNMDDESYVGGRFIDGKPDIHSVAEDAEVTEESEHRISFDVSGRSFIVENDGRMTIVNENADDRFYVSTVSWKPFPPVDLIYNRERQIVYIPYTSKNPWNKADENGFEIFQPDAWVEKHYAYGEMLPEKDDGKYGSCYVF